MSENVVKVKSLAFAVRVVKLYQPHRMTSGRQFHQSFEIPITPQIVKVRSM
jgi:hypothetical protein